MNNFREGRRERKGSNCKREEGEGWRERGREEGEGWRGPQLHGASAAYTAANISRAYCGQGDTGTAAETKRKRGQCRLL